MYKGHMSKHLILSRATIDSYLEVQSILDSAEYYYMKVEGVPKMDNTAKKVFESLPPNCTYDDKFVFFVELNGQRIGVVDLVFGFPTKDVAFIGLLLLDQKYYGQGLGRKSCELIEEFSRNHGAITIQLGVNDTNENGIKFWSKLGYKPNGRTRPNEGLKVNSIVHVLEKSLI